MHPVKILLIDDEPSFLEATRDYLAQHEDFIFDTSSSAEEALDNLNNTTYDVIVSDYSMPGMNGIDLLRQIRTISNIPFILFTGKGDESVVIEAINNGVDFYLKKGEDPEILFAELTHMIRQGAEKKYVDEKLRTTSEQLALALEGSRIGFWDWKVNTGETIFNERWAQIVGYSLSELHPTTIQTWERLTHPDDLEAAFEQIQGHFSGELPFYECEVRMRHKDGHWVYVHTRGKVTEWDKEGKPVRVTGTHTDISHKREIENRLSRKGNILDTLSFAATILMSSISDDTITKILFRIGKAVGVSRVYIYTHSTTPDGTSIISLRYEWVSEGITSHHDNPAFQNFEWKTQGYERWSSVLLDGNGIFGNVIDFQATEQQLLAGKDVKSLAIVPIIPHNKFFGFIGFDDCMSEHEWSQVEIDTLRVAAGLFGALSG